LPPQEHRAALARDAREASLRREAAARRRRLAQRSQGAVEAPVQRRNTSFGSGDLEWQLDGDYDIYDTSYTSYMNDDGVYI